MLVIYRRFYHVAFLIPIDSFLTISQSFGCFVYETSFLIVFRFFCSLRRVEIRGLSAYKHLLTSSNTSDFPGFGARPTDLVGLGSDSDCGNNQTFSISGDQNN